MKKAGVLHEQRDYGRSVPLLRQIVRHAPRDYLANLLLGEDLLKSGEAQQAVAP